jgi:hypothetical protein
MADIISGISATLNFPITSTAIDKTLTIYDFTILVDASGGNRIITLPAASVKQGHIFIIKKIDSSINIVTIKPDGVDTIEAPATLTLQNESKSIQSDGISNWDVI